MAVEEKGVDVESDMEGTERVLGTWNVSVITFTRLKKNTTAYST